MESSGKSLSVARYTEKNLFISLNALQLHFLNTKDHFICNFKGIEYTIFLNSILSQVILHELEHIVQYKTVLTSNDSIEKTLLSSDLSKAKTEEEKKLLRKLEKKYYKFEPAERLAPNKFL